MTSAQPGRQRATLKSVAEAAGVSLQTVSNVLNAPDRVLSSTRDAVLAEIRRQRYHPNRAAQALRANRKSIIALGLDLTVNAEEEMRFALALSGVAARWGFGLLPVATGADVATAPSAAHHDLAAVLTTQYVSSAAARRLRGWTRCRVVPAVSNDAPNDTHALVGIDDPEGVGQVVAHLRALGHSDIAYVGETADDPPAFESFARIAGSRHVVSTDGPRSASLDPAERVARLLDAGRPPTALVCSSDWLAAKCLVVTAPPNPARAIAGFGDTSIASALGLTSVRRPVEAAAASVFSTLVGQLMPDVAQLAATSSAIGPTLVARRSTMPPLR